MAFTNIIFLEGNMKRIFFVLLLAIVGSGLFAQATDAQIRQAANTLGVPYEALKQFVDSYKPQDVPSGTISIDSVKLFEEYRANELKADTQYKGKTLSVTGQIQSIIKDSNNQYYAELKGATVATRYVQVYFKASELSKLANLTVGQRITIVGICDGIPVYLNPVIRDSIIQN